ncbi:inositol monophosphatase [Siccirubricoccus sp. KC 17139]|uniref:Inositol monophosphatase n=1 Tax=Siccirubricoccus soli TaxID=2899147 RepID=A0ABT1D4N5_9PROT|nr:inositol monophosphatase family protein [Siccirubricoccus soli]MCO6416245.1 inositol monophosphatase [Siccirubricoccus soli]MCP2682379.1 inositol monophosphatase [Siccirubricoccus soli]
MISTPLASEVAALLRQAAQAEILPRWRRLEADAIRTKTGPLDLVTDADEAAERVIAAGLRRLFPGCLVVGEEACAADPALLGRLRGAELAFVVDPVDGTANFAAGLPLFGCMAAAIHRGEVIAGWIHDPLGDDTAIALRGEGAWIETAAGARRDLRVAAPVPVGQMVAAVSWGYMVPPLKAQVTARLPQLGAVIALRCAAHEYRLAAEGHAHALVYNRLYPWDHAPGWLLHREAGGYSARFDRTPYSPVEFTGGLIVAPSRAAWEELHATLIAA